MANNREDLERAAALSGAIARVCFFERREDALEECAPTAALAREVVRRVRMVECGLATALWP